MRGRIARSARVAVHAVTHCDSRNYRIVVSESESKAQNVRNNRAEHRGSRDFLEKMEQADRPRSASDLRDLKRSAPPPDGPQPAGDNAELAPDAAVFQPLSADTADPPGATTTGGRPLGTLGCSNDSADKRD